MTGTPDAHHGELLEDEGIILADTSDPTSLGEIRYYGGSFKLKDGTGVFNPRTGGGPHAPTHSKGGSDQVDAQNLGSGAAPAGKLLESDGMGGWNLVDYNPGYPAALEYSSDNTLSSTTSGTFQLKHLHTTAALSLGDYLFFSQAVLTGTANNTETEGRIVLDGVTVVQNLNARLSRPYAEFPLFSMYVLDGISGIHTIALEYRKAGGSGSASIRDARVILWRIA